MKKIIINLNYKLNTAKFLKKVPINWYFYHNYMLICSKFNGDEIKLSLIELLERNIYVSVIKLNSLSILILERNKDNVLIIINKNNRNRHYSGSKFQQKYICRNLEVKYKLKEETLIQRENDIGIYKCVADVNLKIYHYQNKYQIKDVNIYTIKRIVD